MRHDSIPKDAVIYCRTACRNSLAESQALLDQEARCRAFCEARGYQVTEVFKDDGFAGNTADRPGLNALMNRLAECEGNRGLVLVVEDVSRLARDTAVFLHLRQTISAAGGRLECPTLGTGQDADARCIQTILASAVERSGTADKRKGEARHDSR